MFCKILKLSSGDTVIGNIIEETKGFVEVHRPMRVVIVPKAGAEEFAYHFSMMKWDPLFDYNLPVRIFKQNITTVGEASKDVLNVYEELYEQFEQGEHNNEINLKSDDEISDKPIITTSNNQILH